MAVYTVLTGQQINTLLSRYQIGNLRGFKPVVDGIENTNYFVTVSQQESTGLNDYLLTLFEHLDCADLAFYLNWLNHLKQAGLPVAPAVVGNDGQLINTLAGKPAALFHKLPGSHPLDITTTHCSAIGSSLGQLHAVSGDIQDSHEGPRSLSWLMDLANSIEAKIKTSERELLRAALNVGRELATNTTLPQGLIHGDLFPDNSLFDGNQLTGLVDFFSGGRGHFGFDLAVAANAWCSDASGGLDTARADALTTSYQQVRPLSNAERKHWPDFLVIAATRFWVSRRASQLAYEEHGNDTAVQQIKDPEHYQRIVQHRLREPTALPS